MKIIQIYKCFCDVQRLRILNLLKDGPLCVCHLMEILDEDQVKISKQLGYMKKMGILESERFAQWMIYRLASADNPLLRENLKCLQDCYNEQVSFKTDSARRRNLVTRVKKEAPDCAEAIANWVPLQYIHFAYDKTKSTHPVHGQFLSQPYGRRHSSPLCRRSV